MTVRHLQHPTFKHGMRAMSASGLAFILWGMVTGLVMVKSGLSVLQAIGMSVFVYAGAAQLTALPLMAAQAPLWVILLTAFVVNIRFIIYSASIAPFLQGLPRWQRLSIGFMTTDAATALLFEYIDKAAADKANNGEAQPIPFFLGTLVCGWLTWQCGTALGIALAQAIPDRWVLGYGGTLALIALLVPMIRNRTMLVCVLAAGVTATLCHALPLRLGIVCAMLAGLLAVLFVEHKVERGEPHA